MRTDLSNATLTSTFIGVSTGLAMGRPTKSDSAADGAQDQLVTRMTSGVAAGEETAFRELFDRYQDRLFRFLIVLTRGDELTANDLVQSVMLTAAAKLRPVRTEAHLWNWLAQVARQQFAKKCRRDQREADLLSFGAVPEIAAEPAVDRQLEHALETALNELEPEGRRLVELFYFEHRSHQEIAIQFGATAKAVAGRLDRLRDKLRQRIVQQLRDET